MRVSEWFRVRESVAVGWGLTIEIVSDLYLTALRQNFTISILKQ